MGTLRGSVRSTSRRVGFRHTTILESRLRTMRDIRRERGVISGRNSFSIIKVSHLSRRTNLRIFCVHCKGVIKGRGLDVPSDLRRASRSVVTTFVGGFCNTGPSSMPGRVVLPVLPRRSLLLAT